MVEIVGRAGKRLVRLEVDERRIRWLSRKDEVQKEPEILDVPLASLTGFSVVTSRPHTGLPGVLMVGYALWSLLTRDDPALLQAGIQRSGWR